ncbi:C-Maf-inducing protein-like [Babylonia areolata]|uniref:C-Maf-inducing protein-like n=1 Tax=Babylonia areolata TaxID=304850 RepID=UPI003FCEE95A
MATMGDACVQLSSTDASAADADSSQFSVFTPPTSPKAIAGGLKHKLITEADIQVCRLNHTSTIVSKIMNSKYLRRWETHKIVLDHSEIRSTTPVGFMEQTIPYSLIEDVHIVSRWDIGNKFCVRITVPDGSILLQANNAYLRDQWLHSIQWKKHMYRYEKLLKNARRTEVLVKEIKNLVDMSLATPIQDASVFQFPLDLISELLQQNNTETISRAAHENIIIALAPLLENNHPTQEICDFFSLHCKTCPRSSLVMDLFTPVVQRILKHNMDFGKYPRMRTFIQEYLQALNCQNDGTRVVQNFIESMHGPGSQCPHPRVLPNLVAVCLAAIYNLYEEKKNAMQDNVFQSTFDSVDWESKLQCYLSMMETMSKFADWRVILGSLLQPIPFPDDAIADVVFTSNMKRVLQQMAGDKTCEVHQTLLGIREGKEGWFHLYCPGGIACDDDGQLWGTMLETLIHCCCRRKKFLQGMTKMTGPVMLLALRDNLAAMETVCAMLEMEVIESQDMKMQMITTLQTTGDGKRMYAQLCDRQIALRELQQKGGPRKLTLPSKSTDSDLAKMLSSGSFGNLECLSLAFTQVTSACAHDLIKLPSLRYLNLWSTQFGDTGLELIAEHLQKLQVLNLCETPVTDKGLISLTALKNLRKLNLNSTSLSALTFEGLKEKLPALQEFDVRYTDAW